MSTDHPTPAPTEVPARADACSDPDCSRTECLHLGTCFEDALFPPDEAPTTPAPPKGDT